MNTTPAVIRDLLSARVGEYRRPCPVCDKGPRDVALAIKIDARGATWFCHRCGTTGSASHEGRTVVRFMPRLVPCVTDMPVRWSERAAAIWKRSVPLRGTIGETYLRSRNCIIPPRDSDLRFLPSEQPCLIGRITDFRTNQPMSLHFTKLKPDGSGKAGTERDKILLKGHQKKGGVIRLWPDEAVTHSLALAEGIESALSAAHLHRPVWASVDASNLADTPIVDGIETLIVFADHDDAGIQAAQSVVARWRGEGRNAVAWMPKEPATDANDALSGVA